MMTVYSCINKTFASCFGVMLRRKKIDKPEPRKGFSKCLSTFDLIHLGIGASLGAGTYVVTGQVAANTAGPAVVLSFLIAAVTSILSGLCYAEFGARVPHTTGSAYTYSYVTVGEIWAFFIGWNLILEYMIGTAADAAALSGAFDYAIGYRVKTWTIQNIGSFDSKYFGDYPDFLSFAFTLVVTVVLAFGVRESARFTVTFNFVNIAIIFLIVIAGSMYVDVKNWTEGGGFFPYGASGVLSGAATCFYAFVGFDVIATTGEEAKNPSKSIPISIVSSLIIIFVCYFGVSSMVTLMVPYNKLDKLSPIPDAFTQRGVWWANYVISIGAICGLSSSLLGNLFPLPRIIYAMADDGLLFSMFTKLHKRTEVPVNATVYPGIITAVFALLFNLKELVEMMSIGTLLAYTLVSLCVLILRYQPDDYYSHDSSMQPLFDDGSSMQPLFDDDMSEQNEIADSHVSTDLEDSEESMELKDLKDFQGIHADPQCDDYLFGDVIRSTDSNLGNNVDNNKSGIHEVQFKEIGKGSDKYAITYSTPAQSTSLMDDIEETSEPSSMMENMNMVENMNIMEDMNMMENIDDGIMGNILEQHEPNERTGNTVTRASLSLFCWFFGFNSMILFAYDNLCNREAWALVLIAIFTLLIVISCSLIYWMPQSRTKFGFMVPFVPTLPIIAIYANTFLMLKLSVITWVRFTIWMIIGIIIYVFYGTRNSKANNRNRRS